MADCRYLGLLAVSLWQIALSSGSKACTHNTYSLGHQRVIHYSCHNWEYCCSGVCCDYPVLIHRLWYFWVGILSLAFFLLFASVTWYKKRYYGRILRVHPSAIGPGTMQLHTVTTDQFVHTPSYPGPFIAVPTGPPGTLGPPGPPPPYTTVMEGKEGKEGNQPPPAGPMQPAYLPVGYHTCTFQTDFDSTHLF